MAALVGIPTIGLQHQIGASFVSHFAREDQLSVGCQHPERVGNGRREVARVDEYIQGGDDLVQPLRGIAQGIVQVDRVEAVIHVVACGLLDHFGRDIHADHVATIQAPDAHAQKARAATEVQQIQVLVGVAGQDFVGDLFGQLVLQAAHHVAVVHLSHAVEQVAHECWRLIARHLPLGQLRVVLIHLVLRGQCQQGLGVWHCLLRLATGDQRLHPAHQRFMVVGVFCNQTCPQRQRFLKLALLAQVSRQQAAQHGVVGNELQTAAQVANGHVGMARTVRNVHHASQNGQVLGFKGCHFFGGFHGFGKLVLPSQQQCQLQLTGAPFGGQRNRFAQGFKRALDIASFFGKQTTQHEHPGVLGPLLVGLVQRQCRILEIALGDLLAGFLQVLEIGVGRGNAHGCIDR